MPQPPATPPHHRLYVIGDIHGCRDLLTRLLAMVEADALEHPQKLKKLIFLGDYIDRGLDSKGVIERLCGPFAAGLEPVFLRGNHDLYLMDFLDGDLDIPLRWFSLGGITTLASYGLHALTAPHPAQMENLRQKLIEKVPEQHRNFFNNTLFSAIYGDYYFVHAGVNPDRPIDNQDPREQTTIRGMFLHNEKDFGKVIVHGHTISAEPDEKANRIGLDTGAFATGHLTCMILDGPDRFFLNT